MRTAVPLLAFLLLSAPVFGQGMPPANRVDSWKSAHNQKRLRVQWEVLPAFKETKLPDGSMLPPKAPWPFVIYAQQNESKGSKKLQLKVFDDTRFVLATHGVKMVKIKPHKVIDLPYCANVSGVKDPTLIAIDRDFKIVGIIKIPKDFTDKKVLPLMARAAKGTYALKLSAYIGKWFKLLKEEEKTWKLEMKMDKLREKAANSDAAKSKKLDKEADEMEQAVKTARESWSTRIQELQDSLQPIAEKKEALPTTVGKGKDKRELTPEEIEAIQTYKEFSRDKNPIVRAAAVEDMGSIDSIVMVQWILKATNDTDFRVVEAAGRALGKMKSTESVAAMLVALQGSGKTKIAALLGFSHIKRPYPPAIPAIQPMVTSGSDELRRAAIKALENMNDERAAGPLVQALGDRQPGLRVMAANALGRLKAKSAAGPLTELIHNKDWSLAKASVEALAKIRVKESIDPILKAFEGATGIMEEVYYKALVSITGQDYLYRKTGWRKWWDKYGKNFKVPTEEQIRIQAAKRAKALKGYANPNKRKYHKIETLSRKMIFVIDVSGSMGDKIVIPPYAPDKIKEEFPDRVKLEIAKKELIDLLATLEPHVFFNIITFAGKVKVWRDGLVSASAKTAAIKFVAKLKPVKLSGGGRKKSSGSGDATKTNTYGALMAAFGLQDEAIPNWKARTKVDTVFLVTDGAPTVGQITDPSKLIATITDLNRSRGVTIHVIVFDKQEEKKLGALAKNNGGQCIVRGWTGK